MSYHSNSPHSIAFNTNLFNADAPLSVHRAYWLRSNIQQLVDQSGQYRVNWVTDTRDEEGASGPNIASASGEYSLCCVFPITVIEQRHPMNLDIRVAARISGSATSASVSANLYAYTGVANNSVGQSLWAGSGASSSTTASWVIDETFEWSDYDLRALQGTKRYISRDADASSIPGTGLLHMMQLNLVLTGAFSGSGLAHICGVQVREYP